MDTKQQITKNYKRLLDIYYQPLISYRHDKNSKQIKEPLWRFRQFNLENNQILEKITVVASIEDGAIELENDYLWLLKLTLKNSDFRKNKLTFSNLAYGDKLRLLKITNQKENTNIKFPEISAYAVSILLTLFLRDHDLDCRKSALTLLMNGKLESSFLSFENDIFDLALIFKTDLIKSTFVDFSYAYLTGLGKIKIDFSFQYLRGINAKNLTFSAVHGSHFRFSCISEGNFRKSHIEECDFTGSTALSVNMSSAYLNKTVWKQANLYQAIFINSQLQKIAFKESNLSMVNLEGAELYGSTFENCIGISLSILGGAKSIRMQNFQHKEEHYLEKQILESKNVSFIEKTLPIRNINQLIAKYILEESYLYEGNSPSWPSTDRWQYSSYWHQNNDKARLCDLRSNEELYVMLDYLVHLTSDIHTYQGPYLELARMKKCNTVSEIAFDISHPPRHEGKLGSIQIHAIQFNYEAKAWANYQSVRKKISNELKARGNASPLAEVIWHRGNRADDLPIINPALGEAWLFHGTGPNIAPLITSNGFSTKFSNKAYIFGIIDMGYGALGKGVYCSDSFAKAAAYIICPTCKQNHCQCDLSTRSNNRRNKEKMKCIFVSRVLLGSVYIDKGGNRRREEKHPLGYHSSWGPYLQKYEGSRSSTNEFIVADERQIYPEFCVFYTDNDLDVAEDIDKGLETFLPLCEVHYLGQKGFEFKQAVDDYQRVIKKMELRLIAFNRVQIALTAMQEELPQQKFFSEQHQWFVRFEKAITQEAKLLNSMAKKSVTKKSMHEYYWVLDYSECKDWSRILSLSASIHESRWFNKDQLIEIRFKILIIEAVACYQLKYGLAFFRIMSNLLEKNKLETECYLSQKENSYLRDCYYFEGLVALENSETAAEVTKYQENIANWAAENMCDGKWSYIIWKMHFWKLVPVAQNVFINRLEKITNKSGELKSFSDNILEAIDKKQQLRQKLEIFKKKKTRDILFEELIGFCLDFSFPYQTIDSKDQLTLVSLEKYFSILQSFVLAQNDFQNHFDLINCLSNIYNILKEVNRVDDALRLCDFILRIDAENTEIEKSIENLMTDRTQAGPFLGRVFEKFVRGDLSLFEKASVPIQQRILSWIDDFAEIKLAKEEIPELEIKVLKILKKCKILKILVLKGMQSLTAIDLQEIVNNNPNIKTLNISGCGNVKGSISEFIVGSKILEELDISNTKITRLSTVAATIVFFDVGASVLDFPKLRYLNLSCCKQLCMKEIYQFLSANSQVEEINLSHIDGLESLNIVSCRTFDRCSSSWSAMNITLSKLRILICENCISLSDIKIAGNHIEKLAIFGSHKMRSVNINDHLLSNIDYYKDNLASIDCRTTFKYDTKKNLKGSAIK